MLFIKYIKIRIEYTDVKLNTKSAKGLENFATLLCEVIF